MAYSVKQTTSSNRHKHYYSRVTTHKNDSDKVMAGGTLNNGSLCGSVYLNLNNTVGNANWNYGARPEFVESFRLSMNSRGPA